MASMRIEKSLYWLLLALLVWAPVPLGSNRPWAWSVIEITIFALLAAWLILWALGRAEPGESLLRAWPALAILGVWLLWVGLSVVPLQTSWVELLSPEAARMQRLTDAIGVKREWMTLSVDPAASRAFLLKSLAYSALLVLLLALVNNRVRVLMLARVLVYAAVIHAIFAILAHLSNLSEEQFGTVVHHGKQASGTYVNRNHFAGYLEMTLALGIGMLIAGLSDRRSGSWKRLVSNVIEWILSPKMILRLALCILVIALTTTHSRMGNTAFFVSLLVAGLVGIALSRHATRNTVILLVTLVVIDLAIVGSWFGVEKLAQRLEQTTMQEIEEREEPGLHTLGVVKDYPIFGSGPGTFYTTFPRYRPETITAFFDFAHNDYAQFAAETGLVGLGLLGLLVTMTLAVALMAQWQRRDPLMRGMSFACIMGVTSILIHSWVDFNLQIPANAMYFMVLLALGWISLHLERHVLDVPRRRISSDTTE
jgi:putative inorganic carbon (HCO3(-)) transporter